MTPRNVLETGFLPEDFYDKLGLWESKQAAAMANALLEQAKRDAVRVYGDLDDCGKLFWGYTRRKYDTHTALLINIEKIGDADGE